MPIFKNFFHITEYEPKEFIHINIGYLWVLKGKSDNFFIDGQLLPDNFVNACKENPSCSVAVRMQEVSAPLFFLLFLFTFEDAHFWNHLLAYLILCYPFVTRAVHALLYR